MLAVFGFRVSAAEPVFAPFTNSPAAVTGPAPETSREFFNAGTRKLREGKFREAEAFLQSALARQDEKVQPPALYNLGHVRFAQGAEDLKKSPSAKSTSARGRTAAQRAEQATAQAREAMAADDMRKMVEAYMNGRGARKELKTATQAIRRALDLHGSALRRWQRSLGDFKSAAELNPADTNAQHNVETVERAIAKLVDSIREMQQAAMSMAQNGQQLRDKMKQLGGKIPEPMMPPGAKGEDEEDDEGDSGKRDADQPPNEPQPGQREGSSKDGDEMQLSPEQAGWLLDSFKLDGDRRLPMGQGEPAEPKDRKRRNW